MSPQELTAGVLGGMGPDATIDFMAQVVALAGADRDQDHIHLIVDQNPKVPNRQQAIRGEGPDPGPELAAMARRLERAGADFLVMPCNTAHAFAGAIRAAVSIPFVDIVDVTLDEIARVSPTVRRVGVLATDGMLQTGILQDALSNSGREALMPGEAELQQLMQLIHGVKAGRKGEAARRSMRALAGALTERGAQIVIAACTEIPLLLRADDLSVPLISTTEALARQTLALARREVPLPAAP